MLYKEKNAHGGDVYSVNIVLDYSVNLNPLGTPESVVRAIKNAADHCDRYPDPNCTELTKAIARHEGVLQGQILCSNGGAELIYAYCDAVMPERPMVVQPSFSEYAAGVMRNGVRPIEFMSDPDGQNSFQLDERLPAFIREQKPDVLFLCNPNNPDGRLIHSGVLRETIKECEKTDCRIFLDECFLELSDGYDRSMAGKLDDHPGLFILKAFTKNYALAGIRLGYGMSSDTALLGRIAGRLQPWNVSVPAQAAGLAALKEKDHVEKARQIIKTQREWLAENLEATGKIKVYPSEANYMLIRVPEEAGLNEHDCAQNAETHSLAGELLKKGILIRKCENFRGLGKGWYRICVRQRQDNDVLVRAIRDAVNK